MKSSLFFGEGRLVRLLTGFALLFENLLGEPEFGIALGIARRRSAVHATGRIASRVDLRYRESGDSSIVTRSVTARFYNFRSVARAQAPDSGYCEWIV
ncbi:MAG: hypothetical protein V3T64_01220 [Myxococcota bacterium]